MVLGLARAERRPVAARKAELNADRADLLDGACLVLHVAAADVLSALALNAPLRAHLRGPGPPNLQRCGRGGRRGCAGSEEHRREGESE